jgi:hypothetical protein
MNPVAPRICASKPAALTQPVSPLRDGRFQQLLDLAREGDLCAIAELWNRYTFRFPEDEP